MAADSSGGPWLPITSPRTLRACSAFACRPSDAFVCSYPKSGTTWMQNVLAQVVTRLETLRPFAHVSDVSPFFEIDPHWEEAPPDDAPPRPSSSSSSSPPSSSLALSSKIRENHAAFGRRCFNTHLPFSRMPRGARCVLVVRDGRDCAASFFHHLSSQAEEDGGWVQGWDAFFDAWIEGRIAFGSWFEHLEGWREGLERDAAYDAANDAANADAKNTKPRSRRLGPALVVRYQDALRDLPSVVRRVAAHVSVDLTDAEVRAIAVKCGFAAMRSDLDRFQPISVRWTDPNFAFVRRGERGSHAELFTPEQLRRFDAKAREVFGVDEATGAARVPFGAMDD